MVSKTSNMFVKKYDNEIKDHENKFKELKKSMNAIDERIGTNKKSIDVLKEDSDMHSEMLIHILERAIDQPIAVDEDQDLE